MGYILGIIIAMCCIGAIAGVAGSDDDDIVDGYD